MPQSVIWRNGIELLDGETIAATFDNAKQWGTKLRKMYQIVGDRPTAAKLGALDLVNDARYTLPVEVVADKLRTASKRVFRYVIDQPNPWLPSSRAHHAVDILFLFDGLIYRLILRLALLERRCGNVGFVLSTVMDLGLQI